MDDIMVRSRYPRHSIPAKRRSRYGKEKSGLPRLIIRQLAICILILLVVLLVKSIDTPVTNYITGKVQFALQQNIELDNIFKSVDNALGKLKENNILDQNSTGKEGTPKTSEIPKDNMLSDSNENTIMPESSVLSASTEEGSDLVVSMITPAKGVLSSPFGERKDPITKVMKIHQGIDIEANSGENILAALEGTVIDTGSSPTYGKYIRIKHSTGFETVYAHCSVISAVQGQKAEQGDIIAKVGNTGASVGSHLHFEVWKNGKAVNPLEYVSVPLPLL